MHFHISWFTVIVYFILEVCNRILEISPCLTNKQTNYLTGNKFLAKFLVLRRDRVCAPSSWNLGWLASNCLEGAKQVGQATGTKHWEGGHRGAEPLLSVVGHPIDEGKCIPPPKQGAQLCPPTYRWRQRILKEKKSFNPLTLSLIDSISLGM